MQAYNRSFARVYDREWTRFVGAVAPRLVEFCRTARAGSHRPSVLDLCCGDGSYSYLFFSDIAGSVDAVDNDRMAIEYARKTYLADNLRFYRLDAVRDPFPASGYDVIVLNAAISYFSEAEIGVILEKIVRALVPNGFCYGMTPVANDYIDHKTEFEGGAALERVLRHFFSTVDIKLVDEVGAKNLYFCATGPVSTAKG